MRILDQGDGWVAVFKPAGYHVHRPEDARIKVPREHIMLFLVRDHFKKRAYPIHRLDAPTSGVLLMALDREVAGTLSEGFRDRTVAKTYHAVVRGWTPESDVVDLPLEMDSSGTMGDSVTSYRRVSRIEIPEPVGKKYATARYSLLEVSPSTGRYHQIRRHMNRISHPIVGDIEHGDSHHNRFFREKMGLPGLCLKAHALEFRDPKGESRRVEAPDSDTWTRLRALFSSGEFTK